MGWPPPDIKPLFHPRALLAAFPCVLALILLAWSSMVSNAEEGHTLTTRSSPEETNCLGTGGGCDSELDALALQGPSSTPTPVLTMSPTVTLTPSFSPTPFATMTPAPALPDLWLAVAANPGQVMAGQILSYSLTAGNAGVA